MCPHRAPRPRPQSWKAVPLASGQSQPRRTISRRMGVVAETVLAAAHESEEIAPASVGAILCGKVEHPWENRFTT